MIYALIGIGLVIIIVTVLLISNKVNKNFIMEKEKEMLLLENEIDKILSQKYTTLLSEIELIIEKTKVNPNTFKKEKNMDLGTLDSVETDKFLTMMYTNTKKVCDDFVVMKRYKKHNNQMKDLKNINVALVGLRSFYNKCANEYNTYFDKRKYKKILKSKKYKKRKLYEGKVLKGEK